MQQVIIIGGGISGLVAAYKLAENYEVLILEANQRLGGRIHTLQAKVFSRYVEAGAEFMHGHGPETMQLLQEAGLEYEKIAGGFYQVADGNWKQQEEVLKDWDLLLEKMKGITKDTTLRKFLQEHYGQDEQADFRHQVEAYAGGFDLADPGKVSVKSLYDEWSAEEDNFRIRGGYAGLINYLEEECKKKGCNIITGMPVKQIDWEPGECTVYALDETRFYANRLLVTIPVSLLQKAGAVGSINFTPPIDHYTKAAASIEMGTVIKVIIEFETIIWKANAGFMLSDEAIPTWWTQLPDAIPLLTGWAGGAKADAMVNDSEDQILEKAIQSLANILGVSVDHIRAGIRASMVINWHHNPWSLGAYTYATPDSAEAKKLLATPLADTVFFAGEGLYDGSAPGTVEAAISSALHAVNGILKQQ